MGGGGVGEGDVDLAPSSLESFPEDICEINPSHLLVSLMLGPRWRSIKNVKHRVKRLGAHYVSAILITLAPLSISTCIYQMGMTLTANGITALMREVGKKTQ